MTFDSLGVHSTKELTEQYNAARQFIFNYFFGDNIPEPYETKTIYIDNRPYKENSEYSNCIQTAEENRGPWHIMPNFIQVLKNMVPDLTASC